VAALCTATYLLLLSLALLGENYKIYLWQKYLCAIAVIFTLTASFWSVQYILMGQSGEFAQILSRQSYGNPTIPIVMIPLWKQNVAGIPSLRVNAQNAALPFHECGFRQSNGVVSAVAGKMICNQKLRSNF
jgi:hypothetical protein